MNYIGNAVVSTVSILAIFATFLLMTHNEEDVEKYYNESRSDTDDEY